MINIYKKDLICLAAFAMTLLVFGLPMVMAGITGTVDVAITSATEVSFDTSATLDFGEGTPEAGGATLQSNGSGSEDGGDWDVVAGELTLDNIGGTSVSLTLSSSVDASEFIGGTTPTFKWMLTDGEGTSCTGGMLNGTEAFVEVTKTELTVCGDFNPDAGNDELDIDFELFIPYDATDLSVPATITATATAI